MRDSIREMKQDPNGVPILTGDECNERGVLRAEESSYNRATYNNCTCNNTTMSARTQSCRRRLCRLR